MTIKHETGKFYIAFKTSTSLPQDVSVFLRQYSIQFSTIQFENKNNPFKHFKDMTTPPRYMSQISFTIYLCTFTF